LPLLTVTLRRLLVIPRINPRVFDPRVRPFAVDKRPEPRGRIPKRPAALMGEVF
jgi:hypothetical protein